MINPNSDINRIEQAAFNILNEVGVSDNLFVGTRPSSYPDMDDLVVVRVSGTATDYAAIGKCVVSVDLYAKNVGVLRDSIRLTSMWDAVVSSLPGVHGFYQFQYLNSTPSVEDGNGFNLQIINFTVIIKQ